MSDEQKQVLLRIARDSVRVAVKGLKYEAPSVDDSDLNNNCGCFVTLKNQNKLRGCIGQFTSTCTLVDLVGQMAKASATNDLRFSHDPITAGELEKLDIEISVLSPLKLTDDPLSLRLGVDGIYIKKGMASGCFLPQVATETGWSKEEFLSSCCSHKMGLPAEAWKDKDTEVYLFSAEIFGAAFKNI